MKQILTTLLAFFFVMGTAAQERFDLILRRNPWLGGGPNAAGIRCDSVSRSYAEAWFTKENGGLTDYSGSDDSWSTGVRTASVRHFDKVSFAGSFAYDHYEGQNMSGSMFTQPGYYPVDLFEFTPGRKLRDTYAFSGNVAAQLGRRWLAGLKVDFAARNLTKRKDLRHKNTRLDFEAAPGIMYRHGRTAVGLSYIIAKNSDRIYVREIGTTAGSYEIFLDKGLGFGMQGKWDGSGILNNQLSGYGFPLKEVRQGVSLGVQQGAFFAEASFRKGKGKAIEKVLEWYDFTSSQATVRAALSLPGPRRSHFIRLRAEWLQLKNHECIISTEEGTFNWITLGTVQVYERRTLDANAEYELVTRRVDLRAGADLSLEARRSTLTYPRIDGRDTHAIRAYALAVWTFGRWELVTGADFRTGDVSGYTRKVSSPVEPDTYPVHRQDIQNYTDEYFTADRAGVELGLRRNIRQFYIDLSARYEHGFGLRFIPQANRIRATLSLGYNF